MKILQLCKKFPFPVMDGESIAVTNLAKALSELGCSVSLLAMNTSKHRSDIRQIELPDIYQRVDAVDVDNRISPLPALRNLFSRRSYHIERFIDPRFEQKLIDLLHDEQFDVVQLETLYLAPYIPTIRAHSEAKIVLRAHNVEHEIWERVSANSRFLKKWYLNIITPRLRAFEIEHLNAYDLLVAITQRDLDQFHQLGLQQAGVVTPIGIDTVQYQPNSTSFVEPMSISFIGSLDWMPNAEGLKWFLDAVWPGLYKKFPQLRFHIAGRNAPAWIRELRMPGLVFEGEVPDSADFLRQHSIMVAPLLSGSGMRAKILEAMALGKVVVSSRIGLEGIDALDRKEVLLADTPEAYINAIQWCVTQGHALEKVGQNARQYVDTHFDNHLLAQQLLESYERTLRQGKRIEIAHGEVR